MTVRRRRSTTSTEKVVDPSAPSSQPTKPALGSEVGVNAVPPVGPLAQRIAGPVSREEVEATYIAARDAWTAAMRQSASGNPADLASLAIAQQAYEEAAAERQRWINSPRVAITIEPGPGGQRIDAVVGQELAWRRVREDETARGRGRLSGLLRRFRRRD